MLKKGFYFTSWLMWSLFSLFALLILISNFIFQMLVSVNEKTTTAMNGVFIILNVIALTYLLILLVWNINDKKINFNGIKNISTWLTLILYIFFATSSSIALLNPAKEFYFLKAVTTMLSFISAILLFPLIVIKLIQVNQEQKTSNYLMIFFLICYLIINLLLNFVLFLNLDKEIAFLVTVTTLNLIVSIIFFALLTKSSITYYQKRMTNDILVSKTK